MPDKTYKNWKTVTEADFVSHFIETWFAYISTLRTMFPEAYNRRGDKKYLDAYKKFYRTTGYKKLIIDENIMASIEKVYQEGRNVILQKYPEYYLWDFYNINENFDFTYKQIPPDKSECLIVGFKMNRNRGTKWSFIITGFVRLFGKYYGEACCRASICRSCRPASAAAWRSIWINRSSVAKWLQLAVAR